MLNLEELGYNLLLFLFLLFFQLLNFYNLFWF